MTLRTNGLDWLAQNAGSGNCFASSGISYRDADGVLHTGGTKDVVTAFVVANMVGKTTTNIIAGTNYNEFKSINGGVDLTMGDVAEAADRETSGGTYPQYCSSGTTPTPTCTPGTRRCRNSTTIEQCKTDGSGWYDVQTCGTGYTCQNGVCVASGTPTPTPTDKPVTGPMEVYVGGGETGSQCGFYVQSILCMGSKGMGWIRIHVVPSDTPRITRDQQISCKCWRTTAVVDKTGRK